MAYNDHVKIELEAKCPQCGTVRSLGHVTQEQIARYKVPNRKELIQNIFPKMSANNREMLITGLCPSCWDKKMGQEEK